MEFFTCTVCNVEQPMPSAQVHVVPDPANATVGWCCRHCAMEHDGPGKFEGNGDLDGIGIALVLHTWYMDGDPGDPYMSNEGWGYCGQHGRFLLMEDDRGFVTYEEYATVTDACNAFDRYYSDGWGADESDAYVGWVRDGYALVVEGKRIGIYPRLTRARAAMRLWSAVNGYYPTLWLEGERGGLSTLSY